MAKRKSTGKRLRFEIFKRDHFTCQYCGAQPPDVVLVIDHIIPVAAGGETEPENLIASCERCNQGKAGIPLGDVRVRPDADLMYLQTQQEIAELRRYQDSKAERDAICQEIVEDLQATWIAYSALDWHPATHVLLNMMIRYPAELVERAIVATAPKEAGGYLGKQRQGWLKYMWGVLKHTADEAGEEECNDETDTVSAN